MQSFRDLKRLRELVDILFKHEFGFLIDKLKLKRYLLLHKRLQKDKLTKEPSDFAKRLRLIFEDLGGAFIKLGQILSLNLDILPENITEELTKLQDSVKPVPYTEIREIIEKEFNAPMHKIFLKFFKEPIASASVGQVHKAVLKNGKKVAIKIQRPKIQEKFQTDIDLMYKLARLLERHYPESKQYNPIKLVDQFKEYTEKELNYLIEAKNIDIFYRNFAKDSKIKIPKVYWTYTTKKVLCMEYINGTKIKDLKEKDKTLIKKIIDNFMKQIIELGTFHADPHPSNILVLNDKIALIDFGIIGKIDSELKEKIEDMFIAIVQGDKEKITESFINLGFLEEGINKENFEADLTEYLSEYYDTSMKAIEAKGFFTNLLKIARKYNMKFPSNFLLLIKALITLEGTCKGLDDNFNIIQHFKPHIKKLIAKKTSTPYLISSFKQSLLEFSGLIKELPKDFRESFRKKGKIKVDIEDKDIKKFTFQIDRAVNRVSFGIIIAGLLISSALIIPLKIEPFIYGIPWISFILLIASFILIIILFVSTEREKEE